MNEIRDIHLPFIAWLDKNSIPFHRNRPDKKTTAVKGDPDFLCTLANRCLYIECKVPGRKLSKDQEERIAYLRRAGNTVKIAHSVEECIQAVRTWLGVENAAGKAPEHGKRPFKTINEVRGLPELVWPDVDCECPLPEGQFAHIRSFDCPRCGKTWRFSPNSGRWEAPSVPERPKSDQAVRASSKNLFVGRFGASDYVFQGDSRPGGSATIIRLATAADLINLRRR